ncbi:hypothetical protein D3C71_1143470 [compost metagenome]
MGTIHPGIDLAVVLVFHQQRLCEAGQYALNRTLPGCLVRVNLDQFPDEGQRRLGYARLFG